MKIELGEGHAGTRPSCASAFPTTEPGSSRSVFHLTSPSPTVPNNADNRRHLTIKVTGRRTGTALAHVGYARVSTIDQDPGAAAGRPGCCGMRKGVRGSRLGCPDRPCRVAGSARLRARKRRARDLEAGPAWPQPAAPDRDRGGAGQAWVGIPFHHGSVGKTALYKAMRSP